MDIWSQDKLILFIAFVVPGFIALKVYELFSPTKERDTSKQLIDVVSYSCFNYAVMFWPLTIVESTGFKLNCPKTYYLTYFLALFVIPALLAFGLNQLRKAQWIQRLLPHPTQKPWDFVFSQRETYWVRVTLKNGTVIGGLYGARSFASSAPAEEQIYLEQHWVLNKNEGFKRPVEETAGIIILAAEIATVELLNS